MHHLQFVPKVNQMVIIKQFNQFIDMMIIIVHLILGSTCPGDSGGPLLLHYKKKYFLLIAVLSRAFYRIGDDGHEYVCEPNTISLSVDISFEFYAVNFMRSIRKHTEDMVCIVNPLTNKLNVSNVERVKEKRDLFDPYDNTWIVLLALIISIVVLLVIFRAKKSKKLDQFISTYLDKLKKSKLFTKISSKIKKRHSKKLKHNSNKL